MSKHKELIGALVFGSLLATGTFGRCNEGGPNTPEQSKRLDNVISLPDDRSERSPETRHESKHPTVAEVQSQVLAKLPGCQSEFSDYWEAKGDPHADPGTKADAKEVYESCIEKNGLQGNHSVETAYDVFESIQSYNGRCNGDTKRCEQLALEVSEQVRECTGFQPVKNDEFIWRLDEYGEIDGSGTFPGWQLSYEENGKKYRLSLVTFPGYSGETVYHYNTISEDQNLVGSSSGFPTDFESFCLNLRKFPFIAE